MVLSIGIILLLGLVFAEAAKRLKLPSVIGMIMAGILISPYQLGLLEGKILDISAELRQIALVVILTRAGLTLDIRNLKKVGRPTVLLSFVPAVFERLGILILAPKLFGISVADAALLGSVFAAVSPAIVAPRMINLIEKRYGEKKHIPEMILAASSVDDIFVIVCFTSFLGLSVSGVLSYESFLKIPVSIGMGVLAGVIFGMLLVWIFKKIPMKALTKTIVFLSFSFFLLKAEEVLKSYLPISALLGIMVIGMVIHQKEERTKEEMKRSYQTLWEVFQILLFVLVGVSVNLSYALSSGAGAFLLVIGGLFFRSFGVLLSVLRTKLNREERLFLIGSYLPKATVQAAIGGIPLSLGLASGELILTVSVIAILVAAPIGAMFIDRGYERLLGKG